MPGVWSGQETVQFVDDAPKEADDTNRMNVLHKFKLEVLGARFIKRLLQLKKRKRIQEVFTKTGH